MTPHTHRSTLVALALVAAIGGVGFLAGRAEAIRPNTLGAAPTPVGVVNMATLFDRLNESAEWDVKIRNLEGRIADEAQTRVRELESMGKEVEAMAEGTDKERTLDALRLKRLQAEQWKVMKELELDREKSLKWQAVYRSVREGAAKLAEAERFELIIVDDSKIEIQTQRSKDAPPLETQAQSQISQLRVLHAAKSIDVTEKLIVQINNSRAAAPAPTR
jgi:Skp family chaperone for outer membrane proteins